MYNDTHIYQSCRCFSISQHNTCATKHTRAHAHTSSDPENSEHMKQKLERFKVSPETKLLTFQHKSEQQETHILHARARTHAHTHTHLHTHTHVLAQTHTHINLFCLPTFLVHPLQTESEVSPPTRHDDEGEEEDEERSR